MQILISVGTVGTSSQVDKILSLCDFLPVLSYFTIRQYCFVQPTEHDLTLSWLFSSVSASTPRSGGKQDKLPHWGLGTAVAENDFSAFKASQNASCCTRMLRSRDHFFVIGLTVIGLGFGLGLMAAIW